jgi:hypothetical protein
MYDLAYMYLIILFRERSKETPESFFCLRRRLWLLNEKSVFRRLIENDSLEIAENNHNGVIHYLSSGSEGEERRFGDEKEKFFPKPISSLSPSL